MLDPALGRFDHVVGMDSLIHYPAPDMARVVAQLAGMARESVLFTFAPRTKLLTVMWTVAGCSPARTARRRSSRSAPRTSPGGSRRWNAGRLPARSGS